MLKLTVVGWLGMMFVFAGAFRAAIRAVSLSHGSKPEMLAAAVALPGYLVINLNQPILFESDAVLVISLIFGLLLFDAQANQSFAAGALAENA